MKRRDLLACFAAVLCAGASMLRPVLAQAKYPDRPIKLVVPFVPGGVNDAVARLWADRVKASLGAVFIENQGGAGGAVGGAAVAHAQPDGYTILLGGAGSQVLNPIGMSKPLYDPIKDFEPIAILATTSLTIAVTPSLPVYKLKELIAYAKANPGKLVYGSAGTGSMTHLAGELFKSLAATPDIVHVPYKGSGASLTDVISGQVPMIVANITGQVLELHKSGKLRMIAVTGPERLATDPEIPTASESGLPGLVSVNFTGLFAPAKTPKPIIEQIAAATASVMASEEVRKNLIEQGLEPYRDSTPEKTRRFVEEDIARWTPVFRAIGLKLN
ncbi:MAG TPA: tripartite tricarboxylate transporter substrate binding protein [Xanthobacteraceae bacterium]|nr:tripartite tricarboxylate transporter substrate binding protein [Xanthobacteraceae bacterium]